MIALLIVLEMLAMCGIVLLRGADFSDSGKSGKTILKSVLASTSLMKEAKVLKADLKDLAKAIVEQDLPTANYERKQIRETADRMRAIMGTPLYRFAARFSFAKEQFATAEELLQMLDEADRAMIGPLLDLMSAYPLKDIKSDGGFRVDIVAKYLDFCEQILPSAKEMMQKVEKMDLRLIDSDGKIRSYLEKAEKLLEYERLLPLARHAIGNGEDKLYVFAVQNSSEMRSSGGFPGSIGTIRIKNGIMKLSDFVPVRDAFIEETSVKAHLTETENKIYYGRLSVSWDADFCPDFERVASIWALAYEEKNNVKVDGVVSATPVVIQKLLSFLGSITLADGTVLDGENATRVIGHDIYFKYLTSSSVDDDNFLENNQIVDDLFDECAQKTFDLLMSSFGALYFKDYLDFFLDSISDRSVMIWMADEKSQQILRDMGWSGALGNDAQHPEIGVYFNSAVDSKMTWYLDIKPTLSEPTVNADGSKSYELTITLSNVITPEEREQAGQYILGWTSGITGVIYVFAPYGGGLGDCRTSTGQDLLEDRYSDLALAYAIITVEPEEPFVIQCRIDTAPGAEEPIELILPHTMQEYR